MSGFVTHATWITQVGWLLVHSLWQLSLLAALALALHRAWQRRSVNTRNLVTLAALRPVFTHGLPANSCRPRQTRAARGERATQAET